MAPSYCILVERSSSFRNNRRGLCRAARAGSPGVDTPGQAALGGSIRLPGLDGKPVEIKIPSGVQSGEQLRHRGSGMSVLNGHGRGDLVARILVETPTKLNKEQKKLLEEFRATETGDECPASKGFFSRIRDTLGGCSS